MAVISCLADTPPVLFQVFVTGGGKAAGVAWAFFSSPRHSEAGPQVGSLTFASAMMLFSLPLVFCLFHSSTTPIHQSVPCMIDPRKCATHNGDSVYSPPL